MSAKVFAVSATTPLESGGRQLRIQATVRQLRIQATVRQLRIQATVLIRRPC